MVMLMGIDPDMLELMGRDPSIMAGVMDSTMDPCMVMQMGLDPHMLRLTGTDPSKVPTSLR
eukprot:5584807-Alexandrium_andersonii.AAC.1